jgi:hypothetical protein
VLPKVFTPQELEALDSEDLDDGMGQAPYELIN